MKNIGLFILLLCAASQLKAQQKTIFKPLNAPLYNTTQLTSKLTNAYTDSLAQSILKNAQRLPSASSYLNTLAATNNKNVVTQNFYSRMPIAGLHSDDPMPVAGRNIPLTDRMPTKRINIIKADTGGLGRVLLDYNKVPVNGR